MSSPSPERGPERSDVTNITIGDMLQPSGESGIEIAAKCSEPEIRNDLAEIASSEYDLLQEIANLQDDLDRLRARKHSLTEALRIASDKGLE